MIELHEDILDWFYKSHQDDPKPMSLVRKVQEVKEFHKKMLNEEKRLVD